METQVVIQQQQVPCRDCGGIGNVTRTIDVSTFESPEPKKLSFKNDCFYCIGTGWEDIQDVEVAI